MFVLFGVFTFTGFIAVSSNPVGPQEVLNIA